jgi:hypothetical protein
MRPLPAHLYALVCVCVCMRTHMRARVGGWVCVKQSKLCDYINQIDRFLVKLLNEIQV